PTKRVALFCAACQEWRLAEAQGRGSDQEMLARAARHSRELLALGDLPPRQAEILSRPTLEAGEVDLARQVVAGWERQAGKDLAPLYRRLAIEMEAKAYGPALDLADRILKSRPKDKEAHRQRAAAIAGLRRQVEALAPGSKGR